MALVSLSTAKSHLGVTTTDRDGDIVMKSEQASGLVLGRCGTTAHWRAITATWTSATVPASVQSAVLLVLTHLFEHRGDDDMESDAHLWAAVDRLICMYRDRVVA